MTGDGRWADVELVGIAARIDYGDDVDSSRSHLWRVNGAPVAVDVRMNLEVASPVFWAKVAAALACEIAAASVVTPQAGVWERLIHLTRFAGGLMPGPARLLEHVPPDDRAEVLDLLVVVEMVTAERASAMRQRGWP